MKNSKTLAIMATIVALTLGSIGCNVSQLQSFQEGVLAYDFNNAEMIVVGADITADPAGDAAIAMYDLDENGTLDFVAGNAAGEVNFFLNQSATGPDFSDLANGFRVLDDGNGRPDLGLNTSPAVADVDNDGQWELIVGNQAGEVWVIFFIGDWTQMQYLAWKVTADGEDVIVPGGYAAPAVIDINGDGLIDLLVGAGDGNLYYYQNNGTALLPSLTFIGIGNQNFGARSTVARVDLDRDGMDDFVVGNAAAEINFCPGPSCGFAIYAGQMGLANAKVSMGDMNQDGALDLFVGTGEGNLWYIPATVSTPSTP